MWAATNNVLLRDPFAELRHRDGEPWVWCTECKNWSDEDHLRSGRHQRKLEWHRQFVNRHQNNPQLLQQALPPIQWHNEGKGYGKRYDQQYNGKHGGAHSSKGKYGKYGKGGEQQFKGKYIKGKSDEQHSNGKIGKAHGKNKNSRQVRHSQGEEEEEDIWPAVTLFALSASGGSLAEPGPMPSVPSEPVPSLPEPSPEPTEPVPEPVSAPTEPVPEHVSAPTEPVPTEHVPTDRHHDASVPTETVLSDPQTETKSVGTEIPEAVPLPTQVTTVAVQAEIDRTDASLQTEPLIEKRSVGTAIPETVLEPTQVTTVAVQVTRRGRDLPPIHAPDSI